MTGASGYIASWITLYLLEQGFAVRGTTRNDAKGQWMKHMYHDRGFDKFDYVVVSDLLNVSEIGGEFETVMAIPLTDQDNAFDEAVKGVS